MLELKTNNYASDLQKQKNKKQKKKNRSSDND